MSTNWLKLIPTNSEYVPDPSPSEQARNLFASYLPKAREIHIEVYEHVEFIHQGGNWERVLCPICARELDVVWWGYAMDAAFKTRFADLQVTTPCCKSTLSLNDLHYDWPAGFARFVLQAEDPDGDLNPAQIKTLENVLDCTLRKVWVHI